MKEKKKDSKEGEKGKGDDVRKGFPEEKEDREQTSGGNTKLQFHRKCDVRIYQLSVTLPIKVTKTELSDIQGCLQLPLPQVEKDWTMTVRWQESLETDIMITIRLSSHPNFPETSFKSSLSDTKVYLVE